MEKALIVQGTMRFERSLSGWPIVDISQLNSEQPVSDEIHNDANTAKQKTTYSKIPITLGSLL